MGGHSTLISGPFRGRFEIKLDSKGRLSLPLSYRQNLMSSMGSQLPNHLLNLVVTNSRYRNHSCLDAYSIGEWERLERRIAKLPSLRPEVQAFNRFYLSGGQPIEVDAQNRILVPLSLRRYSNLETGAVLVGLGNKFEIWAQDTWNSVYENLTDSFEETVASVAALESDSGDAE